MGASSSRRLGIFDLMLLIAATAAGFALLRETGVPRSSAPKEFRIPIAVLECAVPLLVVWTPACLAVGLRRPRPRWQRLTRQPGVVACGVATALLVVSLLPLVGPSGLEDLTSLPMNPSARFLYTGSPGWGVVGAWLAMRVGGFWRAEPSSIDRLGRALGGGWILVHVGAGALFLSL